jgi:FkbM family methyltransferase
MKGDDWPSEALRCAADLVHSTKPSQQICVLDVGAHRGETFRHISSLIPGALSYYGFEPNPESFALLVDLEEKERTAMRSISFSPVAVGAKAGSVVFRVANASEVSGILSPEAELLDRVPTGDHGLKATLEVEQICIDDFIAEKQLARVNVLKIDTEGYDKEIIRSISPFLRTHQPVVITECFGKNDAPARYEQYHLLADLGYKLHYFSDFDAAAEVIPITCQEDMACWDCTTMGNGRCGP